MLVYLTSFFKAAELPENVTVYSAAVYQPRGFKFPKADWTDIRDETGKWIRPREFLDANNPAEAYFRAMLDHYDARYDDAKAWLEEAGPGPLALTCWCPYDRAAKRQLEEFGSFICHTGPLGVFLATRLGCYIIYDKDRERMYG